MRVIRENSFASMCCTIEQMLVINSPIWHCFLHFQLEIEKRVIWIHLGLSDWLLHELFWQYLLNHPNMARGCVIVRWSVVWRVLIATLKASGVWCKLPVSVCPAHLFCGVPMVLPNWKSLGKWRCPFPCLESLGKMAFLAKIWES